MEVANPPTAAAVVATSGTDWRSQLHPMAREVMVKQIMKILRQHIPVRDSEVLNRLQNIAKGFEEKFYNSARTQSSYLWKIALLLRYVEAPNHIPNHQGPAGLPPQGNSPAQSSSAPLMSRPKTRLANVSASVQASLPDMKGKAPMSEFPDETIGQEYWDNKALMAEFPDETIGQEYWDNIPPGSDDEPEHPGTDTAGPSKNIQTVEAADPVYSELSELEFSSNKDTGTLFDSVEMELDYPSPWFPWNQDEPILEEEGTTNLKKRKFDSASSLASVFGQNTGPVEDHSSFPAPSNSYSRGGASSLEDDPAFLQHFQGWMTWMTTEAMPDRFRAAAATSTSRTQPFQNQNYADLAI